MRQIIAGLGALTDDLQVFEAEENLGLKRSIVNGLRLMSENEPFFTVLEDDCIPTFQFFQFMDLALKNFQEDLRIGMVQGSVTAPLQSLSKFGLDIFATRRMKIWGWGTWARAARDFDASVPDWTPSQWRKFLKLHDFSGRLLRTKARAFSSVDKIDTWDYQWVFHLLNQGQVAIAPARNLVENIGWGRDATHTKIRNAAFFRPREEFPGDLSALRWEAIGPVTELETLIDKFDEKGLGLFNRLGNLVRTMMGGH